jgi:dTDP-glucose 4,6-dehydratase
LGISRSPEPHPVFLAYANNNLKKFSYHQLDLNHDLNKIAGTIEDFRPDCVVNFAAQGMVAQSWECPGDWFQTNTVATIKLHDELRKFSWLEKYVHISTPEVYGSCNGLIRANQTFNPSTPYAISRTAADMSLLSFIKAYDFPVVFTRAANVFGEHQQLYRIIPRTVLFFLTGRKLQLHGGGSSVRSFIHIDDVCSGTQRAAEHGETGDIFHFATELNISIRSLVELIADRLGVEFEDHVELVGDRLGKDAAYLLDCALADEKLKWKSSISLEAGIDRTIDWVKENLEELCRQPQDYMHKP